ncbi:MAG: pyridoxal phosphate-dependent decarboxylase family protein [Hyphomicrobiales bacterium]
MIAFKKWAQKAVEWSETYFETLREYPVRPPVRPGEIASLLPPSPPEKGEAMEAIFSDFEKIIVPGITHWQHPRFFAYFPANSSPPSVIAEYLTAALAAQCMLWQTSPAATELETVTMDWLRQALDLPEEFGGVIQDSASSATLCAILTMRERALEWKGNSEGLSGNARMRIYCSGHAHSSIDKAVRIAGVGETNLVKVPVKGERFSIDGAALKAAIESDIQDGFIPAGIVALTGATSVGACDDINAVCDIAEEFGLYVHVDAAWAGAAMICPELRALFAGAGRADSITFNPHKWLGVNFDCNAHFVRSPEDLVRTLAIQPDYLKTHGHDNIINYSEWSVPLGRRFRALKLWFVLRAYGLENLREMIRNHIAWSEELAADIVATEIFELTSAPMFSLFSFRFAPQGAKDLDALNEKLLNAINDDGRIYLTQTNHNGNYVIRFQTGQFNTTREDVRFAWDVIQDMSKRL